MVTWLTTVLHHFCNMMLALPDYVLACLQNIDPHVLLLIFLPTIGFAPALEQEPHLLRKNWAQVRNT